MSVKPISAETQVPRDWSRRALYDVAVKIQDGTHFSPTLGGIDYKYVTSKNIGPGYLKLESIETISAQEHRKIYSRCDVKYGDLLLTKDGANTGNAALSLFREEVSLLSSVAFVRADHRYALELYLLQYLLSGSGRRQIADAMSGNAITRLTLAKINNLVVPLPPIQEQRKIVSVLTTLDDQIGALKGLIAKKEAIKQGMVRELLTGRIRLPAYAGKWSEVRLGEITDIKTGSRNNQDKQTTGRYPFFVRSATVERIGTYSYDCEAILVPGEGGIGSIFHYIDGKFEVHQRVYKISQFAPGVAGKFIYYYMKQFFGHHAMANSVKATVDSLRLPAFVEFTVNIPEEVEEQLAIAKVLDEGEAEIGRLQSRLIKAKMIKQGMMQELLTGRTRLPIAEEVTV